MDVTAWLLRHTPPRPMVVTVPGGTEARLAVERAVRDRGWRTALSPAEATLLVVAGPAGGAAEPYVEQVWNLVPAPRARADVRSPDSVSTALDAAEGLLRDVDHQRQQAIRAGQEHAPAEDPTMHGHDGGQAEHGHHDHDMGGMSMPGDVPMADRAEDRDGLMLDQLRVPLGPVLPDWPAGLIVRTSLQGDVIQHATVELLSHHQPTPPPPATARPLDSCARLLAVAGWPDAAVRAQRLRDAVLDGDHRATDALLPKWARRVRRSRTLRWLLADIGTTPDGPATPPELRGDAHTRLLRWIEAALAPKPPDGAGDALRAQWTVDHLPAMLEGTELAVARLIVASLDPDLDLLSRTEAHHG